MKRLISTLNLSKEDWLRYRKCGITGTGIRAGNAALTVTEPIFFGQVQS